MKLAILIIDMVQDTFDERYPITKHAQSIVPAVNRLNQWARDSQFPVIFSCDSFLEGDFLFQGRMKPHSIRGTKGALVARELHQEPEDTFLPKRRFSAFFKTDLDQTLRLWGVDTVAVAGISTQFCVLATIFDALCNDFRAILVEDACAAADPVIHRNVVDHYRRSPLYPLLQVMTCDQLIEHVN